MHRLHRGFKNGARCFSHFIPSSSLAVDTSTKLFLIFILPRFNHFNFIKWSGAFAFPIPWSFFPNLYRNSASVVSYFYCYFLITNYSSLFGLLNWSYLMMTHTLILWNDFQPVFKWSLITWTVHAAPLPPIDYIFVL